MCFLPRARSIRCPARSSPLVHGGTQPAAALGRHGPVIDRQCPCPCPRHRARARARGLGAQFQGLVLLPSKRKAPATTLHYVRTHSGKATSWGWSEPVIPDQAGGRTRDDQSPTVRGTDGLRASWINCSAKDLHLHLHLVVVPLLLVRGTTVHGSSTWLN